MDVIDPVALAAVDDDIMAESIDDAWDITDEAAALEAAALEEEAEEEAVPAVIRNHFD